MKKSKAETLKKPSVLLIIPRFYGYDERIRSEFESRGFKVYCYATEPSFASDFSRNLLKGIYQFLLTRHCNSILTLLKNVDLAFVLVIRGHPMSPKFFHALRVNHPKAIFSLYEWDTEKRVKYLPLVLYFNKVFSFEREDCTRYGFTYLPLFHVKEFAEGGLPKKDIDLVFIGGYHPARDKVFDLLMKQALQQGYTCFMYEYIPFILYAYLKIFKKKRIYNKVKFRPMPITECAKFVRRSKAVVDIEHDGQGGITIRTIEALAAGAKVITTNSSIVKEPFYFPNTVLVVERENPILKPEFLFYQGDLPNMKEYSLSHWVGRILEISGL